MNEPLGKDQKPMTASEQIAALCNAGAVSSMGEARRIVAVGAFEKAMARAEKVRNERDSRGFHKSLGDFYLVSGKLLSNLRISETVLRESIRLRLAGSERPR